MPSVADVLQTDAFESATIVAGHEGLSNPVKTITVAEVPDASDWLRGGEIVCTTAFFVRDSSVSQVQWIESLILHGASALAIKSTRFLGQISKQVKWLANSKKFPIINLPDNSTWPYIIESVMNLISDEQIKQLHRSDEIHTQLTQLVLDGNSIKDIARSLANLVSNPIIVEDGGLNLIASGFPDHSSDLQPYVNEWTDQKNKDKWLHSDYYQRVLNGHTKEILQRPLSKTATIETLTIPIIASQVVYGFLILIEARRPHTPTDMKALEHGATAIALQLTKEIIQSENRREKEQEMVQALINGRLQTNSIGQVLPTLDLSSPMIAVLIRSILKSSEKTPFTAEKPERMFKRILTKQIGKTFNKPIVAYKKNLFTVLIPFQPSDGEQPFEQLHQTLEHCLSELEKKKMARDIQIAIGGIYHSRAKLKKSYEDAKKTLEIMRTVPSIGPIASFGHIGIYRLIHMIKDDEALRSFRNDFLELLLKHDEDNDDLLCETLYTYLQMGGNITVTSKSLFVHPNTVNYRLRKIKSIIGDPMAHPQYRESLLFALEIDHYLQHPKK